MRPGLWHRRVRPGAAYAELALADLLAQFEPARKRFFQDSYSPAATSRLL